MVCAVRGEAVDNALNIFYRGAQTRKVCWVATTRWNIICARVQAAGRTGWRLALASSDVGRRGDGGEGEDGKRKSAHDVDLVQIGYT